MTMVENRPSRDHDATRHLPRITSGGPTADPGPVPMPWWGERYRGSIPVRGHAVALLDHQEDCLWLEASLYGLEPWIGCGLITSVSSRADCRVHLVKVADRDGRDILRPDPELKIEILRGALQRLGVTQR